MKRILYVTKHNPWGVGGGSVASRMYLIAFMKAFPDAHIDLCISANIPIETVPQDIKCNERINLQRCISRSAFSRLMSPITGITHRYQNMASKLLKTGTYNICIFDHSAVAGTLVKFVPPKTKTVVIHHNFEPDYFRDNTTNAIMRALLLPTVRRCEKTAFKHCDINIFLTQEDLRQFKKVYGDNTAQNVVTGIFETIDAIIAPALPTLQIATPTIVITGSLNNVQNTDGIRYFINELYPLVPPEYKVIIAGKNPTPEIKALVSDKKNIELVANPQNMSDVIMRGNIFLSPARLGGGIKVRVTDGLKAGLPVIAHETSARGYALYAGKGYLKTFSCPSEFKEALVQTVSEINEQKYTANDIAYLYKSESSLTNAVSKITEACAGLRLSCHTNVF